MGKLVFLSITLFLLVAPVVQSTELLQSSAEAQPIQTFSASPDGFQSQFDAIVAAYRAGDNAGGRRLLNQFQLPRAEEWLTEHLGQERAGKFTERYNRLFPNFADSLEKTILDVLRHPGAKLVTSIGEGSEEVPSQLPPNRNLSGITAVKKPALFYCRFAIQMNGREQNSWANAFTYEDGAFRFVGFGAPPFWVWEDGSKEGAPKGGSFVQSAILTSTVPPVYPVGAKALGVQGIVTVHFVIDKTGHVKHVTVVQGDPALRQAAVDAVSQWRYKPATLGGIAVETDAFVNIQFRP